MVDMRDHIESLGRHGAMIKDYGVMIPVTVEIYEKALESCRKNGYSSVAWEMTIPETDEPMMLCVRRDGHVDSGSVERICEFLGSHV